MKKFIYLLVCLSITGATAQNSFTLEDVIQRSQSQSPSYRIAETRKENRYWQYRYYKTNYIPQLRLLTNTFGSLYTNQFTPVRQPDGSVEYRQLNQFNPGLNFSLQQPIALTGGQIWVNSTYNYFDNYTTKTSQWNGTPINIFVNQPLFAFNQLKWDRRIEPIKYEESKREYSETMEAIARDAADLFFSVLQQQINLQIAQFNLANNDTIYKIEQGRYNIGTTSEDKLLQIELQLLRSRQDVAQARLDFQTASLQLRTFIGVRNGEEFELVMPDVVPLFSVGEAEALEHAKETRSAFVAFQRRKFEAESAVAEAKGQRYQVSLTASYGLNNIGQTLGDLYQDPARQQAANLSINVPVIDWGRRKALMRTAYANKKLTDYIIDQDQITFEQEILTKVRQFEMLRLQIEITKKSDEVALARYNVAQNRYLIGKTDILNLSTALREKDEAKRSYIQALKSFWSSYYDLRRLTLYDFIERKYLYNPFAEDKN
jgi:outer membrane protein TolC